MTKGGFSKQGVGRGATTSGWWSWPLWLWRKKEIPIAVLALVAIAMHLLIRFAFGPWAVDADLPLKIGLVLGGVPLVLELLGKVYGREFGSDLLAGISIVTAVLLGEYLAGVLVVLMLSGGEAIESYAVASASSVLRALANRMPSLAHRQERGRTTDIGLDDIRVGDTLVIYPHEICPVDGTVIAGHSVMDESYLTGEPYMMSKTPGSEVLSGAINGDSQLTIRADKLAVDSRYAKIMGVMRESSQQRPHIRRMADQLGAFYTPIAVALAVTAWVASGEPVRFLSVLVVATPCPLLIAIPVAIISAISLSARRGIIIKDPKVLEQIDACRTVIFDKTGTLTYGRPSLTEQLMAPGWSSDEVLSLVASVERYSKHPLAAAIVAAAERGGIVVDEAQSVSERAGKGLQGVVRNRQIRVTSRQLLSEANWEGAGGLPPPAPGMECVILVDDEYAATYRFRDAARKDGASFVNHLQPKHAFDRVMLVSGDREGEVRYLAEQVGITEVHAGQSPEQKLAIVRQEVKRAKTIFVGDGINDAPALMAATVGIAFGQNSDITTESAGAVIMDSSLKRVDELMHVGRRMRRIALQSAVGGMSLSMAGMLLAAMGYLPPVAGAVAQEVIDVFAVLNALRVALGPRHLSDY